MSDDETTTQRLARLRPLVPNTVRDEVIKTRIAAGWSDLQIVSTDLLPQAYTGRAKTQMYRGRR